MTAYASSTVRLTDRPDLPTELYRHRCEVELFFKWIKQHLRIRSFYSTSANIVKTQIWIAISVYVLVAIVRKQLQIERELYTLLQILSACLFEKLTLLQALTGATCTVILLRRGIRYFLVWMPPLPSSG